MHGRLVMIKALSYEARRKSRSVLRPKSCSLRDVILMGKLAMFAQSKILSMPDLKLETVAELVLILHGSLQLCKCTMLLGQTLSLLGTLRRKRMQMSGSCSMPGTTALWKTCCHIMRSMMHRDLSSF